MRIQVRLFAVCRERAGADQIEVELAGSTASLDDLRAAIAATEPALEPLLPIVRIAIDQSFAVSGDTIQEGQEVALIPPVSGGAGQGPFRVQSGAVDARAVEEAVRHPGAGAVLTFVGTVRDDTKGHAVEALEYEAYEGMAEKYLRQVGDEACERWPALRIAIVHRTGRLEPGEPSVVISVSSPHRADAFEACRYAIERLKEDVPIWKKEVRRDGSVWVGIGS